MADLSGVNLTHQQNGSWGVYASGNYNHPGPAPFPAAIPPDYTNAATAQQEMSQGGKFPTYPNQTYAANYNIGNMTLQTQPQQQRARQQSAQYHNAPFVSVNPGLQAGSAVLSNRGPIQSSRIQMPPNNAQPASQNSQFVCLPSNPHGQVVMPGAPGVFPSGDNSYGGYDSESMGAALRTDMHHKHKGQYFSYDMPTAARQFGPPQWIGPGVTPYHPSYIVRPGSQVMNMTHMHPQAPVPPMAPMPHVHPRPEQPKNKVSRAIAIVDPATGVNVMQKMMDEKEETHKKQDMERKKKCADFQLGIAKALDGEQPSQQLNDLGPVEASAPPEESVYEEETDYRHDEDAHQTDSSLEDNKSEDYKDEKREYERQEYEKRQEMERIQEQNRIQQETREREEHEQLERERIEREKKEHERIERERLEHERIEHERIEHERIEHERIEHERIERERIERLERERIERLERERRERERREHERIEREKQFEKERERQLELEQEKHREQERLAAELRRKEEEERMQAQRLAEEAQREKERLDEEARKSEIVHNTVIEPVTAVSSLQSVDLPTPPPPAPEASNSKKKKKQNRDQRQKPEYSQPTSPARQSPVPMQPKPMSPPPAEPEEKQELGQKEEEETDTKIMERNVENLKVPPTEPSEEIEAVNDEPNETDLEQFKTSSGKMAYSRDYMMKLKDVKLALTKPPDLPNLACVLNSPMPQNVQTPMVSQNRGGGSFRDNIIDPMMPMYMDNQLRTSMGGNRHGMYNRGGGPKMNYQQVIKLSINKPVELNKSENAWVPDHKKEANDNDEARVLYKKARGILNKLTPQKFDSLVGQFRDLPINTQTLLKGVIDLVFDKAVEEPNYCHFYARLCQILAKIDVPSENNETSTKTGTVNFRKLLLTKCQQEYERDKMETLDKESWNKKIEEETEPKKKEDLKMEMEEAEQKIRRRYLGNVRFIGELYKAGLLSVKVMHECIQKMLYDWDEDKLECLCKLMVTIGANLEKDKVENKIEHYFTLIKNIEENKEKNKLSSRVRFMLQDLRDMRHNNWKPRREVAGPKKIAQVHEDMEKEALKEQLIIISTPTHGGRNDKQDRRGDTGRKGGYNQGGADEWNQVPVRKNKPPPQYGNEKIEPNKLPSTKMMGPEIKLGPGTGMSSWNKGSQGGRQETRPSNANMFNVLSAQTESPQQRNPWGRGAGSRSGSQTKENAKSENRRYGSVKQSYSQERRRPEDSRQNLPARDGRGSAASSRESSVSREREFKSLLKGQATLDEDAARHAAELFTDEYIGSQLDSDMLSSVAERFSDATIHMFVTNSVFHVLEKSPKDRKLCGAMLDLLMVQRYLSPKQLQDGFEKVMETAEDLIIDIPKLFEYIGEILEPLLNSTNANKSSKISLTFLRDAGKSCIQSGYGSKMLAGVLKVLSDKSRTQRAAELWNSSGCKLSEFLGKDQDEKSFIGDNKFEFVFGGAADTSQSQDDLSTSILDILRLNKEHSEIQKLLDKAKDTSNPKDVVRALTTAILKFCCGTPDNRRELNSDSFKELNKFLLKAIGQQAELEMECLLSVQQFMNLLQHPPELPMKIFELLYDQNTVTEDTFFEWRDSSKEGVGKGGVTAATKNFFAWLQSAEEEDSSDKDSKSNEER